MAKKKSRNFKFGDIVWILEVDLTPSPIVITAKLKDGVFDARRDNDLYFCLHKGIPAFREKSECIEQSIKILQSKNKREK